MTEPHGSERSGWGPLAWRNYIKVAQLEVKVDARLARTTPGWVSELAAKDLPELERPRKRRRVA